LLIAVRHSAGEAMTEAPPRSAAAPAGQKL